MKSLPPSLGMGPELLGALPLARLRSGGAQRCAARVAGLKKRMGNVDVFSLFSLLPVSILNSYARTGTGQIYFAAHRM